jgi:cyclopropane fatty-acyl-phospholipid synthase-like methyltransferase
MTTASEFFEQWTAYNLVLDHNYMFHGEIFRDAQRVIEAHYCDRPLTVLDLGCGSARHSVQALRGRTVARFTGYDLAEAALVEAARNLAALNCPIELKQCELLDGLRSTAGRFDLIFCSFALHHLAAADKAAFFREAFQRLNEDGMLLLVDVMREPDEDPGVYLERYCAWVRSDWKALSPEALNLLCDHIRQNDVAETASDLRDMAAAGGFDRCVEINRFRWHHTWCLGQYR